MKKFFGNKILKIADILELVISILLSICIGVSIIFLIIDSKSILFNKNDITVFNTFLAAVFNLVIGIEFVKMLCKHTPATVIEVLLFAIARKLIVEHTSALDNLIGIVSIGILFAIRKYLFYNFDEVEKTIYRGNERIKRINLLEHIEIPYNDNETLEDIILREIEERKLEFGTGVCVYYPGFALRIAKVKDDKITRIEVIKSIK